MGLRVCESGQKIELPVTKGRVYRLEAFAHG